jgi:hypothetical protein
MPPEIVGAALLLFDRALVIALDSPLLRGRLLTALELGGDDVTGGVRAMEGLFRADPAEVQAIANKVLGQPNLVVHAVPRRPRKPKLERELRELIKEEEEEEQGWQRDP